MLPRRGAFRMTWRAVARERVRRRNIYIDALRGLSIFVVLLTHAVVSPNLLFFLPQDVAITFAVNGGVGVTIFFVVSGFLITSHSLSRWEEPTAISPADFYVLRVARIFPLLLLFLGICSVLFFLRVPGFVPEDEGLFYRAVSAALTFQYNNFYLTAGNVPGLYPMTPLWSLAIEEMFYLVFPLAMLALKWRSLIAIALIILIVQGPAARETGTFYGFWGCADALALGCGAGMLVNFYDRQERPAWTAWAAYSAMLAGLAVILGVMTTVRIQTAMYLAPSVVAFGAAIFLIGAYFAAEERGWDFPKVTLPQVRPVHLPLVPLAAMGALSYELYLFHWVYAQLVLPHVFWPTAPIASSLITVALLGGFALLLSRTFSEPLNKKIRERFPHSSGAEQPSAPSLPVQDDDASNVIALSVEPAHPSAVPKPVAIGG